MGGPGRAAPRARLEARSPGLSVPRPAGRPVARPARARAYRSFPPFPARKPHLAFFVPAHRTHADMEEKMRAAAGRLLQSVRLFDVYQGTGVPQGQKSLAYSLDFADP